MGVNLNPVAVCVLEQAGEGCAISNARIQSRELAWKCEAISQTFRFSDWQREKAKFGFAVRTRGDLLEVRTVGKGNLAEFDGGNQTPRAADYPSWQDPF
jgi:hypothetical protein